ncbi:hypothetical protein BpHYR1_029305 [Brachionus plicatilis]|uniref:Uncharacterized protein n=1 Tax=Brachionus plicatilis TaxID=10195 RepID=A0A3M7PBM9_BRAPC|nr:hypothetical protein BpHYR1_029305 [Brachionus plicatilis]
MSDTESSSTSIVTEWSKDRDPNFTTTKKFITKPEISVRQWTKAFEWCKLDKRIVKLSHNNELIFMFTSTIHFIREVLLYEIYGNKLESQKYAIQNSAVRFILKLKYDTPSDILHNEAFDKLKLLKVSSRLFELAERYVGVGLSHSVPLVTRLVESRFTKYRTTLCNCYLTISSHFSIFF